MAKQKKETQKVLKTEPKKEPKFDGTKKMSPDEKNEIIAFLADAQKMYKKNARNNRFLGDCFRSIIRPLSLNIGQYNNCWITQAAKKLVGDFNNISQFDRLSRGKGIVKEHKKPASVLLEEFYDGFKDGVESWFKSCEIVFITKEEDIKLRDAEKELRRDKTKASLSVFEIHKLAYKNTGLDKNIEKVVIKEK